MVQSVSVDTCRNTAADREQDRQTVGKRGLPQDFVPCFLSQPIPVVINMTEAPFLLFLSKLIMNQENPRKGEVKESDR